MERPLPPIEDLCVFLKIVHESTKSKPTAFGITTQAKELKIMYYNVISKILQNKGIILKQGHKWLWISTTEPNIHMSSAILTACNEYTRSNVIHNSIPHSNPPTPNNSLEYSVFEMEAIIQTNHWYLTKDIDTFDPEVSEILWSWIWDKPELITLIPIE